MPLEPVKSTISDSAVFNFGQIEIYPNPIVAGEPFDVNITVSNFGKVAVTYKAILMLNGNLIDTQILNIGPGMNDQVKFRTSVNTPGKYEIKIGSLAKTVIAVKKSVETILKLGNGVIDGFDPIIGSTSDATQVHACVEGYLIKLNAPDGGFIINKVDIMGYIKSSTYDFDHDPVFGPGTWAYGPDIALAEPVRPDFSVTIYDGKHNRLYTGNFSKELFTYSPGWITVSIPSIKVAGDFFIEVNSYNPPRLNGLSFYDYYPIYTVHTWYYQLYIGYENAIDVQSWVSVDGSIMPDRYLTYNWLIQAAGYPL